MSKEIEELQNQLYISDKAHQRVCAENVELEQKIEELQKEVERLNRLLETQNEEQVEILVDKALKNEENTKLREQVRELEENMIGFLDAMEIEKSKEVVSKFKLLDYINFGKLIAEKTKSLTK